MAKIRRNLAGMKFGKLTAIEYKGIDKFRNALWLCKCDCGNTIIVKGTLLTTGRVVSCGECDNKYNFDNPQKTEIDNSIVGKRFGRLLVLDEKVVKNKKGKDVIMCKCKCDCGNTVEVLRSHLTNGLTKSCGCLQKERVKNTLFNLKTEKIGQRVGLLTVLSYDTERKKWKCKCDCGNITYIRRLNGNAKSCGCLKKMTFEERKRELEKGGNSIE